MGPGIQHAAPEQQHSTAVRQHLHRQPGSELQAGQLHEQLRYHAEPALGRHLRSRVGQLPSVEQQPGESMETADQFHALVQLPTVLAARVVDR